MMAARKKSHSVCGARREQKRASGTKHLSRAWKSVSVDQEHKVEKGNQSIESQGIQTLNQGIHKKWGCVCVEGKEDWDNDYKYHTNTKM